jgi:hypothetical protein
MESLAGGELSNIRTKNSIFSQTPQLIVIGAGLWHLASKMSSENIEGILKNVRRNLELSFSSESQAVLFQLQTKSLYYDHRLYNSAHIDQLNNLIQTVMQDSPTILIFDSHLKMFDSYAQVCRTYFRRSDDFTRTSLWHCNDPNHAPFLLTSHFVRLIFLHFCSKHRQKCSS